MLVALLGNLCGCNRDPETVDDVFTNLSPAEFEELRNSTPPKERPKPPGPELSIAPQFVDIASEAGIQFQYFNDEVEGRFFLPESMGGGAAWVDYDGDGCLDLYLVNGSSLQGPGSQSVEVVNHLFRNLGQQQF
ncbi:MAG: hypothetical protein MK364_12040 [Pirellulales bacterium]|nr:hypothetical protein [Pirellulales bacterium]